MLKIYLLFSVFIFLFSKPTNCDGNVNVLEIKKKSSQKSCGADVCYVQCSEFSKDFKEVNSLEVPFKMRFGLKKLVGSAKRKQIIKSVCIKKEYSSLTRRQRTKYLKIAMERLSLIRNLNREEKEHAKKVFKEYIFSWLFMTKYHTPQKNFDKLNYQLSSTEINNYYLSTIIKNSFLDNELKTVIGSVRADHVYFLLKAKSSYGLTAFYQAAMVANLPYLIGKKEFPLKLSNGITIWRYIQQLLIEWKNHKRYCARNGIKDLQLWRFRQWLDKYKSDKPYYPFHSLKYKLTGHDLEYFNRVENLLINTTGLVADMFYTGVHCFCYDFMSYINDQYQSNSTIYNAISDKMNTYNKLIYKSCKTQKEKLKTYTFANGKTGASIMKDKSAMLKLSNFLQKYQLVGQSYKKRLKRKNEIIRKTKGSLTNAQFNEMIKIFKKSEYIEENN